MNTTLTAADKTIVSASLSVARLTGRWDNERDIRVTVTIDSLSDVSLLAPITFYGDVRLSNRNDDWSFEGGDVYSASPVDWTYDEDADGIRYFYSEDESIIVSGYLAREVADMICDLVQSASIDAQRAYEDQLRKSLGL